MIPVLHGVWSAGGLVGDYEHIETITVGAGGAASVAFSSIAGTYKHLQIRGILRSTANGFQESIVRFNSDSGNNYSQHQIYGSGVGAASGAATSQNHANILYSSGNDTTASVFAGWVFDILDYASTSKNKTVRSSGGFDANGSGYVFLRSAAWLNSSTAITSISIASGAGNLAQYSTFSLYGVK